MEVEKLVQLAYRGENHLFIDNFKTETFVNGICHPVIQLAVCSTDKSTFAETVTFALARETTRTISRPIVSKVRECLLNTFIEILKQILGENEKRDKLKCFNCGEGGHFQGKCKAARKKSRLISPTR